MEELKPCPFCGQEVEIVRTDSEGNFHPEEYFDNPWSGVSYHITHDYRKVGDCPISTQEDDFVGCIVYQSEEELIENWNFRQS